MKRLTIQLLILGFVLVCAPTFAQQSGILSAVSPKLHQFLAAHAGARQVLTNTVSKAFTGRTVELFYFYSDDASVNSAFHYYPSESVVGICVRENQQPSDEFITLLFELVNSEGETQFKELHKKAASGDISRTDFAQEILKVEFTALIKTRNLLRDVKFTRKEISNSSYYKRFSECPDDFPGFMSYTAKMYPNYDPLKGYEAQYDLLRKP